MRFILAIVLMGGFIGPAEAGLATKESIQLNEEFARGVARLKETLPPEQAQVEIEHLRQRRVRGEIQAVINGRRRVFPVLDIVVSDIWNCKTINLYEMEEPSRGEAVPPEEGEVRAGQRWASIKEAIQEINERLMINQANWRAFQEGIDVCERMKSSASASSSSSTQTPDQGSEGQGLVSMEDAVSEMMKRLKAAMESKRAYQESVELFKEMQSSASASSSSSTQTRDQYIDG